MTSELDDRQCSRPGGRLARPAGLARGSRIRAGTPDRELAGRHVLGDDGAGAGLGALADVDAARRASCRRR